MLNSVIVQGRITNKPEVKVVSNGDEMIVFSVCHTRDVTNAAGFHDFDYFDCVAWNGVARFVSKNFDKGDMIILSGKLQVRSYKSEEGVRNKNTEIVVENAYFGNRSNDEE